MEWLQKIYICILNPFCGISQKINDTTRKRLIYTVVLLLYSTCYIWYSIIGMGHPLTLLSRLLWRRNRTEYYYYSMDGDRQYGSAYDVYFSAKRTAFP